MNLRERVPPRQPETGTDDSKLPTEPEALSAASANPPTASPAAAADPASALVAAEPTTAEAAIAEADNASDSTSIYSDTDLPPALLPGDSYDALICGSCVLKNSTLVRYAGTPGARVVVPAPGGEGFVVIGEDIHEAAEVDVGGDEGGEGRDALGAVGTKRRAADDEENPPTKRPRASPNPGEEAKGEAGPSTAGSTCLAPPINKAAQSVIDRLKVNASDSKGGYGDVFLSAGWRDRWCKCSNVSTCITSLLKYVPSIPPLPALQSKHALPHIRYTPLTCFT